MAEDQGSETMTSKGRIGVYGVLILFAVIASALISFDALNDETAEVTDQLDPTTIDRPELEEETD